MQAHETYRRALADRALPAAVLDRWAFEATPRADGRRAGTLPVWPATKPIRCRGVLERLPEQPGFEGLMCYAGTEAAGLAAEGFADLLVAYPAVDRSELRRVADAETVFDRYDGRPRWGKHHTRTAADFDRLYPQFEAFRDRRRDCS